MLEDQFITGTVVFRRCSAHKRDLRVLQAAKLYATESSKELNPHRELLDSCPILQISP